MKTALLLLLLACVTSTLQQNFFRRPAFPLPNYFADSQPEKRAFGVNILAYNYLSSFLSLTVTSTSLTTTTSTVTVGNIVSCYASDLFTTLTNCRKRRDLISVLSALDRMKDRELSPELVRPSKVELVVPTAAVDETPSSRSTELSSSFNEARDEQPESSPIAVNRLKRFTAPTTTVTSTVTSLFFYTNAVTTTFRTDVLAAASDLLCVPAGFALC